MNILVYIWILVQWYETQPWHFKNRKGKFWKFWLRLDLNISFGKSSCKNQDLLSWGPFLSTQYQYQKNVLALMITLKTITFFLWTILYLFFNNLAADQNNSLKKTFSRTISWILFFNSFGINCGLFGLYLSVLSNSSVNTLL